MIFIKFKEFMPTSRPLAIKRIRVVKGKQVGDTLLATEDTLAAVKGILDAIKG